MAELADALALGASAERHAGSSPVPRTKYFLRGVSATKLNNTYKGT
jgi:hypothetical protein